MPQFESMIARGQLPALVAEKDYEIRFCPASGLYFQTWVMEDRELTDWYTLSGESGGFADEIAQQKLHWFSHMTEEILVFRQLCPKPRPMVLDFGCYWGKWASMALAHGCDVYAVEVNRAAADFCAGRGIKIISFEEMAEHRFDFINVDQVMEHLSSPLAVAQKLAECLHPGGFLKMGTPDKPHLPRLLRAAQGRGDDSVLNARTLYALAPLEHVNLFNRGSLEYLGRAVGLEPCRLPFFKWMGAGQLWNMPRQFNRNITTPLKRWLGRGPYVWCRKA
jgi:SAM-dependent methyltransferase